MDSSVQAWLEKQCASLPGARNGFVLLGGRSGHSVTAAVWPADSRVPNEVYATARDTVLGKLPIQRVSASEASGARIVSTPIRIGDRQVGALAIAIDPAETASSDDLMGNVRRGLAHLFPILGALQRPSEGSAEALRLAAAILSHSGFARSCTAFANELTAMFHCHRVSVGVVKAGMVHAAAVSHHDEPVGGTEVFGEVEAAMEEAIDQTATIRYPPPEDAKPRITIAHAALARMGQGAVMTLPMVVDGIVAGAVTLETSRDTAFTDDEQALLEQIVGLLAPLLILKREAAESAGQRLQRKAAEWLARLRAPGVTRQKLIVGGVVGALVALLVVPVPYRVTAPARVEGEIQRILAAPTDGFLQQVHVRPGDPVREGQILVELAQQDLLLERRKWQGEYAQHENAYGAAMARNDRVQLAISMARMQEAQAQLDLVDQQLVRASLAAPFDGIVAEGDLTQSLGAPVKKGDKLITVAPRDRHRIIVEVDELDIARVSVGDTGALAPTARPGDRQAFRVTRITPVATVIGDRNVFEVEGALEGTSATADAQILRPGMKGAAKIDVGWRPIGWVFFHRFGNWLRLAAWRWGL